MQKSLTSLGAALLLVLASACSDDSGPGLDGFPDTIQDTTEVDTSTDMVDTTEVPDTTDVSDPPPDDGYTDTIGMICSTDEECQNGLYCDGEEICPYGFCQHGDRVDCSDGINCTLDTCNEDTDSCEHEVDDEACDDSNPCTTDTCEVSTDTCVNEQIDCSDTVNCTLDTCDTTTGDCVHTIADEACDDLDDCTIDTCEVSSDTCINTLIDGDGDLHPPESCGGDDCDDTDSTIYTGATEICDDGIDQDCDGADAPEGSCDCPVSVSVGGVSTGDTTGMSSAHDGTCAWGTGSPEVVHRLDISSSIDLRIAAVNSSWWETVLYIQDGACGGTELACNTDWSGAFISTTLAAGTYYIFVDGADAFEYGPFSLSIAEATTPVPVTGNDVCGAAYTITSNGVYSGNNSTLTDTGDGTCVSGTGYDAWYTFTLSSSTTVHLDTFGSYYDTVLYVRSSSCMGTEVGCNDDTIDLQSALDLPLSAGTYYVVVDAYDVSDTGDYDLYVSGMP